VLLARIDQTIKEVIAAPSLSSISDMKKLKGEADFYRIRVGGHRVGIAVVGDIVTFVRCLPRKDIYRKFP